MSVFNVGFHLGPRLNAAGRMENPAASLNLLLANDSIEAEKNANLLDGYNRERQKIERDISTQAVNSIRERFNPEKDFVIVEGNMEWHLGVIGIVASRVMREFYRPTFILASDGDGWKGSARSIEGFDLAEAMRGCDDLLNDHGGHAMAAGVSVKPGRLDAFRERINEIASKIITPDMFQPPLKLDAETDLSEMTLVRVEEMGQLEPLGQGNPEIQLLIPDLNLSSPVYRMGKDRQHAKFWVTDERGSCEVIAWNLKPEDEPKDHFDLAVAPPGQRLQRPPLRPAKADRLAPCPRLTPLGQALDLERGHSTNSGPQRQPTKQERHTEKQYPSRPKSHRRTTTEGPARSHCHQRHHPHDIKKTQHETERAAEAADDLARVFLAKIGVHRAQTDCQRVQRERHHADRDGEVNYPVN